jgi:dTDP-4-dehydrorhamnose 3,5-epimerase
MLEMETFEIEGPLLLTPKKFADSRGYFSETYSARALATCGISEQFVQDNQSLSVNAGTVRGLHFQSPPRAQGKLVRVLQGRILDVFLDIRTGSPTYGQCGTAELSAENWRQIFVPVGFAHGFCTLEPNTIVLYKTTDFYSVEHERSIKWNDPPLKISWPKFAGANVSPKDDKAPPFGALISPFSF